MLTGVLRIGLVTFSFIVVQSSLTIVLGGGFCLKHPVNYKQKVRQDFRIRILFLLQCETSGFTQDERFLECMSDSQLLKYDKLHVFSCWV